MTFTYDGRASASGMTLYVNGVEESSYTDARVGSYTAMENLTAPVTIGHIACANDTNAANNFARPLAGLGIWDHEQSQEDIPAI